jgi:TIR domain
VATIFISYRRGDSSGHAGRLCDRLTARFGDAAVFMDLQDIAPGQNFARSIDETIARCDCVVAVIGPRWVEAFQQRSAGTEDFVQHEIAAALRRDIALIPVLVGGARMPLAEQLPQPLAALCYRNALEVRDERFDDDVTRLSEAIGAVVGDAGGRRGGRTAPPWRRAALVAFTALILLGGAVYLTTRANDTATPVPRRAAATTLDGDWIAEMQKQGQPSFTIRLTFITAGDSITGMVRYPTGDAPILDAQLAGDVLTFHTSHVPQFASLPAIIRFQSAVGADEIRFTATDESGIAQGIGRRASPSP